jgi:hypothetical protein
MRQVLEKTLELRALAQEAHDVRADLEEFDGDRRGHYAYKQELDEDIVNLVLEIFPDKYKELDERRQ